MTVGAQLALGSLLHARPDRDDARSTDLVVRGPLRHFGLSADEAERICSLGLPDLVSSTPPSCDRLGTDAPGPSGDGSVFHRAATAPVGGV